MAHEEDESPENESPWTEAQWEAFMKRSDLRSARFGELLETLRDDPDRDDKISHEMGWDQPREEKFSVEYEEPTEEERAEIDKEIEESDRALEAIPAYKLARKLGLKCMRALKKLDRETPEEDDDLGEVIGDACIGANITGAKIAGGHGMGYDEDVLCGNIVNNRRGLEGAEKGLAAWKALKKMKKVPAKTADKLIAEHEELIRLMNERIEELRKKVWW